MMYVGHTDMNKAVNFEVIEHFHHHNICCYGENVVFGITK